MHRNESRTTVKIETGRFLLPVCIETRRALLPEETWQRNGFPNTISGLEKIINKKGTSAEMRRGANTDIGSRLSGSRRPVPRHCSRPPTIAGDRPPRYGKKTSRVTVGRGPVPRHASR